MVHPPSLSQSTSTPAFTLVRLSATSEKDDWHQTNLPLPPNPETHEREPRWATEIEQSVQHQLPRRLAFQMMYNPDSAGQEDGNDNEDEVDDESDYGSYAESDKGGDGDGDGGDIAGMRGLDTSDQVHTTRMRIWGMASSPGKGVTAVFVSPHSTLKPDRITFGGMKCKVLFGRHIRTENAEDLPPLRKLSTEARMWEWLYGDGAPVPGFDGSPDGSHAGDTELKKRAAEVARSRPCPFCEARITPNGTGSVCANGHIFGTSGLCLAMAPGC